MDRYKSVLAGQCSQHGKLQVHGETLSQQCKIESRERHPSIYLYVETYCRVKGPTGAEKTTNSENRASERNTSWIVT